MRNQTKKSLKRYEKKRVSERAFQYKTLCKISKNEHKTNRNENHNINNIKKNTYIEQQKRRRGYKLLI